MKKLFLIAAVCACAIAAVSDTATVTVTATGADAYSDPINVSGYLDRVEIVRDAGKEGAVINVDLATWSGTTAVETYVDINNMATNSAPVVVRPRVLPTTAAGVVLAAATTNEEWGTGTNAVATTVLVGAYEKPLVGGNLKLKVGAGAGTNAVVTATLYYQRLAK